MRWRFFDGMGCRSTKHINSVADQVTTDNNTAKSKFSFDPFIFCDRITIIFAKSSYARI